MGQDFLFHAVPEERSSGRNGGEQAFWLQLEARLLDR
jgi:hypothetical protein